MSFDNNEVDLLIPLKFSTLKFPTSNAFVRKSLSNLSSSELAYISLRYADFFSTSNFSSTEDFTFSNSSYDFSVTS